MSYTFDALSGILQINPQPWVDGLQTGQDSLRRFNDQSQQVFRSVEAAGAQVAAAVEKVTTALTGMGLAAGAALAAAGRAYAGQELAERKLAAVLQATGKAAGGTQEKILALANDIQKLTTFGDDAVITSAALLATMESVDPSQYERTIRLAADLAAVMGKDLPDATFVLAKAMEDPERGMTMLRRAGVILTQDQQALVKSLVETGRAAEAQALILDAVAGKVGGAAESIADSMGGRISQAMNLIGDMGEAVFQPLAGQVQGLAERVVASQWAFIDWMTSGEQVHRVTELVNAGMAALEQYGGRVADAFQRVSGVLQGQFVGGAQAALEAARGLWEQGEAWFGRLPQWAQDLLLVGGALSAAGLAMGSLGSMIPIVGPFFTALASLISPVGMLSGALSFLGSVGSALLGVFGTLAGVVGGPVAVAIMALGGAVVYAVATFEPAREKAVAIFTAIYDVVKSVVDGALASFHAFWTNYGPDIERVLQKIGDLVLSVGQWIAEKLLAPDLATKGDLFIGVLDRLLTFLGEVARYVEALIDLFNGDWRRAFVLNREYTAMLIEGLADLIDTLGQLITLGQGNPFQSITDGLRQTAAEARDVAAAFDKQLEAEAEAARKAKEIEQERKRLAAEAEQQRRADERALAESERKALAEKEARAKAAVEEGRPAVGQPAAGPVAVAAAETPQAGPAGGPGQPAAPGGAATTRTANVQPAPARPVSLDDADLRNLRVQGYAGTNMRQALNANKSRMDMQVNDLRGLNLAGLRDQFGRGLNADKDLRELVRLRDQIVRTMAAASSASGDAKEQMLRSLVELEDKYEAAYDRIGKKISGTFEQAGEAAEQSADRQGEAVEQVEQRASRSSPGVGAAGFNMVAQVGQQLQSMLQGAVGAAFNVGGNVAAAINQIADPVARLDAMITHVNAQISGLSINNSQFGGVNARLLDQARLELAGLQGRRQALVAEQAAQREAAAQRSDEAFARFRRQRAAQQFEDAGGAGGLASAVVAGERVGITIQINGVNDVREAFDRVQAEIRRRGYDRSGRRGAFQRK